MSNEHDDIKKEDPLDRAFNTEPSKNNDVEPEVSIDLDFVETESNSPEKSEEDSVDSPIESKPETPKKGVKVSVSKAKEPQSNDNEITERVEPGYVEEVKKETSASEELGTEFAIDDGGSEDEIVYNEDDEKSESVIDETFPEESYGEDIEDIFEEKESDSEEETDLSLDEEEDDTRSVLTGQKVKSVIKKAGNPALKEFKNFKPSPEEIILHDFTTEDDIEQFRKQYLGKTASLLGPENFVRCPLPYSGHLVYINSYNYADLTGIQRNINSTDVVTQIERELSSIYDHINFSNLEADLTFEKFLKETYLPDIEMLYNGVYNAINPGINTYPVRCSKCGDVFNVEVDNNDLGFITDREYLLSQEAIDDVLGQKDRDKIETYRYVKRTVIKKVLPKTHIYVEQSMPTLFDYLMLLKWMRAEGIDEELIYIVAKPRFFSQAVEDRATTVAAVFYRSLMFIRKIGIPILKEKSSQAEKVKKIVQYKKMDEVDQIFPILNQLSNEDALHLLKGDDFKRMFNIGGLSFRITDIKCENPSCGANIDFVALNMRDLVFGQGAGGMEELALI